MEYIVEARNIKLEHDEHRNRRRLAADVSYSDKKGGGEEAIWFDVDEESGESLSTRADPWICYLLPLAAMHQQPVIRVEGLASRRLLDGIPRILSIWKSWYPTLRTDIRIECDDVTDVLDHVGSETAVFFSGGVDSFFTALYEETQGQGVDCLLAVMGWDIRLSQEDAVIKMVRKHERVATALGKKLIVINTNMRDARFGERSWGTLTHGAALAMVAHALSPLIRRALIASTHSNDMLIPWGSHPETDPYYSTEATEIIHHGAEFNRVEKTRLIAEHQVALDHLHVCWRLHDEKNCDRCEKCLRTMAALELFGALDRAPCFSIDRVPLEYFQQVKAHSDNVRCFLIEVRDYAREVGRNDMAEAINQCLRRGRLYGWLRNRVPDMIGGKNGILGRPLRALWRRI